MDYKTYCQYHGWLAQMWFVWTRGQNGRFAWSRMPLIHNDNFQVSWCGISKIWTIFEISQLISFLWHLSIPCRHRCWCGIPEKQSKFHPGRTLSHTQKRGSKTGTGKDSWLTRPWRTPSLVVSCSYWRCWWSEDRKGLRGDGIKVVDVGKTRRRMGRRSWCIFGPRKRFYVNKCEDGQLPKLPTETVR